MQDILEYLEAQKIYRDIKKRIWDLAEQTYGFKHKHKRRGFTNIDGTYCQRTPMDYPYTYDEYVQYYDREKCNCAAWTDRMMNTDYDRFTICCLLAFGDEGQYFTSRTVEDIQYFLRLFYDDYTIVLHLIVEGCNLCNGYPYWRFEYSRGE